MIQKNTKKLIFSKKNWIFEESGANRVPKRNRNVKPDLLIKIIENVQM